MPIAQTTGSHSTPEHQAVRFFVQECFFQNGTSTAAAATCNGGSGIITTEALSTSALTSYSLVMTNSLVAATDIVRVEVQNGTNTQGMPIVGPVAPGAGTCTIVVYNAHATQALNGTLKLAYTVIKSSTQTTPNSI
jgi:hypothetical protein